MTFDMLYSKIHRATVSDANLNYVGSITIDEELMQAAAQELVKKVDIVTLIMVKDFKSYVIKVARGSKDIPNFVQLRKVQIGDPNY